MRRPLAIVALALLAGAAAACGDDDGRDRLALRTPAERRSAEPLRQAAKPEPAADQAERPRVRPRALRTVLRGWGDALRHDRGERAARYFTVPTVIAQGDAVTLETATEVQEFNERFPCGARLLHVQQDGRFLIGSFELTRRPAHDCQARGDLLRVAFALEDRKIAEWREIPQGALTPPDQPGGAQSGGGASGADDAAPAPPDSA